jgi:hypothetical protein
METDETVLAKADPLKQESLQAEVTPDPMDSEQPDPLDDEAHICKDFRCNIHFNSNVFSQSSENQEEGA